MSTRSAIIVEHRDGTWKCVYCHWDGYLCGVGLTLHEHYTAQAACEALVAPGDISSLGARSDLPPGHTFNHPVEGYTVYYARDRGETSKRVVVADTLLEVLPTIRSWARHVYVWKKNHGWFLMTHKFTPLADALRDAGA